MIEDLRIFIKNEISEWALPNPEASGPEYFLPCNFEWRIAYDKYVFHVFESFGGQVKPVAWGTFQKYYKELDTFKKL